MPDDDPNTQEEVPSGFTAVALAAGLIPSFFA
jgi:hypothetical protein